MSEGKNTEKVFEEEKSLFNLHDFLKSLKKIGWLCIVLTVSFALVSFVYFKSNFTPLYRSSVRFAITPLVSSNSASGSSVYSFNYNSTLATQMAETFPYIMRSNMLSNIVANDLGRPVSCSVTSVAVPNTNIFEVHVTSASAKDAYEFIQSLMVNYPKVAEIVIGDTRMNIIEGSEPELAVKPFNTGYYYKYVALAALVGLVLGLFIVVIHMWSRKAVMDKNDIEYKIGGKCICEIPSVKKKRTGSSMSIIKTDPSLTGFSEAVRLLKQRTRSVMESQGAKVIGITSSAEGEGKTTVAYNLAKSLSNGSGKVLLLDMDLHHRAVQQYLNRKKEVPDSGITEVVRGKVNLNDAIHSISNTMDVIFAGEETVKFRESNFAPVFEHLRGYYDYIVVDLSTCGLVSETVHIANLCDVIMFVVKWNTVNIDKIKSASKYMAFSDAKLIGYVLNDVPVTQSSKYGGYKYYYGRRGYGYGYGRRRGYGYGYGGYGITEQSQPQPPEQE